jgi:hypothetical protein
MYRIVIAMIVLGGVLTYWGYQEMSLASKTDPTPQEITCQELSDSGPGDNAHVVMSDFLLCTMAYVYEGVGDSDTAYKTVWVPAVPLGGAYHQMLLSMLDDEGNLQGNMPLPRDLAVLVKTSKVTSGEALDRLADRDTLSGLVINEIASLGSQEKKILIDSYPGVDFDKVWILEHGRKPAGAGKMYGLMGGGLALMLVGLGIGASGMGLLGRGPKATQDDPLDVHPSEQENI